MKGEETRRAVLKLDWRRKTRTGVGGFWRKRETSRIRRRRVRKREREKENETEN